MSSDSDTQLSDIERELIAFFVNAAQAFGLPKSVGEIYGLYFASEQPLPLDQVVEKLQISKGSASQGIRFLRSINALNPAYVSGDRRDHHVAETSLRRIADGFIRQRIRPELKDGAARLKEIARQSDTSPSPLVHDRIDTITSWTKKADLLFPFVSKFLGKATKKETVL
ncbi:hypothetical protein QEH56_16515 [Pelagicoccus enzymogenes]|uniref:GbsR/MarR family transcriptional regulator n=1 Tax=Pelagicoccus enzymogenes TaxID=2773457 RepID=UPI00280D8FBA|nr:hypothetical protein [Pelagicoccus enzymogenes]MDQ8199767.1 hypothetical protein [Pelagicoccus enzymogenes]